MVNNTFDSTKRRTLKLLAGTTVGLVAGLPAYAGSNGKLSSDHVVGEYLDCTLISRADLLEAYLLMHNNTRKDIIAARFSDQRVRFDGTLFNLADGFVEPMVIAPTEKVIVRLNVEAALQNVSASDNIIDLNDRTRFLSQGTRIVNLSVRINNGVATVDNPPPA